MSDVVGITGKHQSKLKRMEREADVPQRWHNTPVNALIAAQNFNHPVTPVGTPQILIATCIDFRLMPKVPPAYAYVIRVATGRLIGLEFALTYGIAEGVKHVALIGHDDCGMTKISQHGPLMIDVLVDQGWDRERAEEYVASQAGRHEIEDEVEALKKEFFRLKRLFKKVEFAPLFASVDTGELYVPIWYLDYLKEPEATEHQLEAQDMLL